MALKLELRQTKGPDETAPGLKWQLERGRRTLGRARDCDWQVEDPGRTVSKLHCVVEAARDGFILRDESANGSRVDGRLVQEGETTKLVDGSTVELGAFAFKVSVTGESDPELGDPEKGLVLGDESESLTISAILADVAPAGERSTGLRGTNDAWSELPEARSGSRPGALSSRNVEIGWTGPPEPDRASAILPDDWNEESGSDYSSRLEHASATRIAVPVARSETAMPPPGQLPPDKPEDVFEPDADAPASIPAPPIPHASPSADPQTERLTMLVQRCEEACGEILAVFDIDPEAALPAAELFGRSREDALAARLEALLRMQVALKAGVEGLVDEAHRLLEPRIIEAKVDTEPRRLPWLKERSYWQSYKSNFEKDGAALSVRDLFREAMLRRLPAQNPDEANSKE